MMACSGCGTLTDDLAECADCLGMMCEDCLTDVDVPCDWCQLAGQGYEA